MRPGDPQWTARIEEDEGAQDPLAMNRVTDRLLRDLLPGITTISPRPRYIAHHLWALSDVAENDKPESRAQLMRGLYGRERIILLSGARHSQSDINRGHSSIIGTDTANKLVNIDDDGINLEFSFSSNRSGSYGRNYVGPLQTMGLVDTPDNADFEAPTERAEPIVDAYETVAKDTSLSNLATADTISFDQLDTIAQQLCPCAVSEPTAPDRKPLRAVYLGHDSFEEFATQAHTRRDSLALILHIARLRGDEIPLRPKSLLNACYYGTVLREDSPVDANIPSGLNETAARWKALRAHDYFAYTTEALLTSWLAYLKATEEADATLKEFKLQAQSQAVCDQIADRIDLSTLTPETPLSAVISAIWPDSTPTALTDDTSITPVPMIHNASEHKLDITLQSALSDRDWPGVHATVPCLLLTLTLRYANPSDEDAAAWDWLRSHTKGDLSPVRLREHIITHIEAGDSFGDFIEWFIDEYMIRRATEVAAGKSDGVTATRGYFEQTAAGWRHVRSHEPGHWGARFDSAVSVLRDLALLDPDPSMTDVTSDGIELLESQQEGPLNAS